MDSTSRASFLAECRPGGKYDGIVGIYRENESASAIGTYDKEIIKGLPSSVKWIAHNGAGYDPVDVHACKARGMLPINIIIIRAITDLGWTGRAVTNI